MGIPEHAWICASMTSSFRHERAFRSAATRYRIDRSCVPYPMSAVESASLRTAGRPVGVHGQAASPGFCPASNQFTPGRKPPRPLPGACYLVMADDAARACRNKGEADAAGLVKSGRLWL